MQRTFSCAHGEAKHRCWIRPLHQKIDHSAAAWDRSEHDSGLRVGNNAFVQQRVALKRRRKQEAGCTQALQLCVWGGIESVGVALCKQEKHIHVGDRDARRVSAHRWKAAAARC